MKLTMQFSNAKGKYILKLMTKTSNLLFLYILLVYLLYIPGVSTSTVNAISNGEPILETEHLKNRIRDYTRKTQNFTSATHDLLRHGRKIFVTNSNLSSFNFYTDEIILNLLNHEEILQRHYIFKTDRNTNFTKAHINNCQQKYSHTALTSDEDYFLEYDDHFTAMSPEHFSKVTRGASCLSCQHHKKVKKDSLESIKKHILMRLQLSKPPNITVPPPMVPQKILDLFYKNLNHSKIMSTSMYTQYFNNNTQNRATKMFSSHEANDGFSKNIKEEDEDKMISDHGYDYSDDDFPHPSVQFDGFYSRLHSIYVFPTKSRHHHNRKPEILHFKYNSDPTRISSTILHVYIKGLNWIYEYQSDLIEKKNMEVSIKKKQEIMIIIYRALRRPNTMNYTHTVKLVESRQKIPPGKGHWVEIEVKELSTYWMKTPNSTQSIVIRGMESWMRTFIVTEDQSSYKSLTMHIEIVTKVKNRYKRNAALDCRESDNEVRCCRYPLKVNFTNFGWNFIVAPQHFDAYFCNGECNIGYLEKHTHTHITSLSHITTFSTSAKPCCSPQKLSPLAILYFDNNNKLMYSTIPNMSVEKCSCS